MDAQSRSELGPDAHPAEGPSETPSLSPADRPPPGDAGAGNQHAEGQQEDIGDDERSNSVGYGTYIPHPGAGAAATDSTAATTGTAGDQPGEHHHGDAEAHDSDAVLDAMEHTTVTGIPIGYGRSTPPPLPAHIAHGHMMGPQHLIMAPTADGTGTAVLAIDRATGAATYVVVPGELDEQSAYIAAHAQIGGVDDGSVHGAGRPPVARTLGPEMLEQVSLLWRMSRTIRLYACADMIVVAFAAFFWPYFAILILFPMIGIYATYKYYLVAAVVYAMYFPLVIAGRIYVTYSVATDHLTNETLSTIHIVVGILGILLELYCLRLALLFARQLRRIDPLSLAELRSGTAAVDRRFSWW